MLRGEEQCQEQGQVQELAAEAETGAPMVQSVVTAGVPSRDETTRLRLESLVGSLQTSARYGC